VLHRGQVRKRCDALTLLRTPSDAFAARFVGYENVYDRSALDGGAPDSLRAWLRERSGEEGVAFTSPTLGGERPAETLWEGRVRSARPGPSGLTAEVLSDELLVALRIAPPVAAPLPPLGGRVRFRIDPATIQPLGPSSAPRVGT
jgi:hypothetical protein